MKLRCFLMGLCSSYLVITVHAQTGERSQDKISADSAFKALSALPRPSIQSIEKDSVAWVNYYRRDIPYRITFCKLATTFWHDYPTDPRRYPLFLQMREAVYNPYIYANIDSEAVAIYKMERKEDYSMYAKLSIDEKASQEWQKEYASMRQEFWASPFVTENDRMKLRKMEIFQQQNDIQFTYIKYGKIKFLDTLLTNFAKDISDFASSYHLLYKDGYGEYLTAVKFTTGMRTYPHWYGLTMSELGAYLKPLTQSPDSTLSSDTQGYLNLVALQSKPMQMHHKAVNGKDIDLRKLRGKVVLLDLWSTTCESCIENMPSIKKVYERYHGKGFEVISLCINPESDLPLARKIEEKMELPWPVLVIGGNSWEDKNSLQAKLWKEYGFDYVPQLLLLNQKGYLDTYGLKLKKNGLEPEVKRLLNKK